MRVAASIGFVLLSACGTAEGSASLADASVSVDGSTALPNIDGGGDGSVADGSSGCGELAGDTAFTCTKDGTARGRCPDGHTLTVESCARGCLRSGDSSADSTCLSTADNWSCNGSYGTKKVSSGDYYLTAFGCWKDAASAIHTDPGDNCIPGCLAQAQAAGLCAKGSTGPECEESVTFYTADSGRFGCLARLRITNPKTGTSVVAVVLDAGPSCTSVEDKVSKGVLDASGRVDRALFGSDEGYADMALVHVVEVDPSTPLGP